MLPLSVVEQEIFPQAQDRLLNRPVVVQIDVFVFDRSPKPFNKNVVRRIPVDPCTVLFRGIMSFPPNYDAVLFFADDVMPLVWQKHPEALFKVVGAHPPNFLVDRARHEPRLKLVGFVDDLREPMQQATVIVCPMRSGSGIKNKVLESLAMEKAVVATPMSLAGISAEHEANLLIGQSAQELAAQITSMVTKTVMRDQSLYHNRS